VTLYFIEFDYDHDNDDDGDNNNNDNDNNDDDCTNTTSASPLLLFNHIPPLHPSAVTVANYTYTGAGRRPPKYKGGLGNANGGNGNMMMGGGGSTMQGISSNEYNYNTSMTGFGSAAHPSHSHSHGGSQQVGGMGGTGVPGHGQAYYSGGSSMQGMGGGDPTPYVAPSAHYKPSQFASSRPLFNQAGSQQGQGGQTFPPASASVGDYSQGSGSTTNTAPSAANLHSRAGKKAE
jgi:hypothetical protein